MLDHFEGSWVVTPSLMTLQEMRSGRCTVGIGDADGVVDPVRSRPELAVRGATQEPAS